ncbi:MAG: aminoglycoside adenylyltransferase domain-containing protein [Egibacteraceae bacterium]
MPELPPAAHELASAFLELVDARLPGRIEGLYLTGSIALGDFRPGVSDIDFVAMTVEPLSDRALDVLDHVHAELRASPNRPALEGIYLCWADLANPPAQAQRRPYHLGGVFHRGKVCFEANPVTWQVLGGHAVVVRGPAALDLWADPKVLAGWTIANLNSYWASWVERHASRLADTPSPAQFDAQEGAWGALGVARLHYTLATGGITSKDGAGAYAMAAFPPRWHRILSACRAARRQAAPAPFTTAQFGEVLAFMRAVIDDANTLARRQAASFTGSS